MTEFVQAKVTDIENVLSFMEMLLDQPEALKVAGVTDDYVIYRINKLRACLGMELVPHRNPPNPLIGSVEVTSRWTSHSMDDSWERVFTLKRLLRENVKDDHYDLTIVSRNPHVDSGMWRSSGLGFSLNGLRCLSVFVPHAIQSLHADESITPNQMLRTVHSALTELSTKHPSIKEDTQTLLDTLYTGGSRV